MISSNALNLCNKNITYIMRRARCYVFDTSHGLQAHNVQVSDNLPGVMLDTSDNLLEAKHHSIWLFHQHVIVLLCLYAQHILSHCNALFTRSRRAWYVTFFYPSSVSIPVIFNLLVPRYGYSCSELRAFTIEHWCQRVFNFHLVWFKRILLQISGGQTPHCHILILSISNCTIHSAVAKYEWLSD